MHKFFNNILCVLTVRRLIFAIFAVLGNFYLINLKFFKSFLGIFIEPYQYHSLQKAYGFHRAVTVGSVDCRALVR